MIRDKHTQEERVKYTDIKFPISVFDATLSRTNKLQIHWHNDLEIIKVLEGSSRYIINGYTYDVSKGDIVIVNPKQVHQAWSTGEEDSKNRVIQLKYNLLKTQMIDKVTEEYILPLIRSKYVFANVVNDLKVYQLFDSLDDFLTEKPQFYELSVKSIIYILFTYLFSNGHYYEYKEYMRRQLDTHDFIRKTVGYIQENYDQSISLNQLSELNNISKYHLCHIFKKNTNMTISEYITDYRLTEAIRLLQETKKNITTISYDIGFNSTSYFILTFKKKYGLSPGQYRKQHR